MVYYNIKHNIDGYYMCSYCGLQVIVIHGLQLGTGPHSAVLRIRPRARAFVVWDACHHLGRLASPGTPVITHYLFSDDGLIQFSLNKVAQYIIIYILTSYFSFKARLLAYYNPYNITHRHFCVAARVGLLGVGRGCDPGVLLDQV